MARGIWRDDGSRAPRTQRARASRAALLLALVAGCHWPWSKLSPLDAASDAPLSDVAASTDASDAVDVPVQTPCNQNDGGIPIAGDPCVALDQLCSYTSADDLRCRPRRLCDDAGWLNASVCPRLVSTHCTAGAEGEACTTPDVVCGARSVLCRCTPDPLDAGAPTWRCAAPAATGCLLYSDPPLNIGAACATPGLVCDYGAAIGEIVLVCQGGVWSLVSDADADAR